MLGWRFGIEGFPSVAPLDDLPEAALWGLVSLDFGCRKSPSDWLRGTFDVPAMSVVEGFWVKKLP